VAKKVVIPPVGHKFHADELLIEGTSDTRPKRA
jgi:hypothetical protein